jgi:hypothetical protein
MISPPFFTISWLMREADLRSCVLSVKQNMSEVSDGRLQRIVFHLEHKDLLQVLG